MKRLATAAVLFALLAPAASRAEDWKIRFDFLLADGLTVRDYRVIDLSNKRLDYYRDFSPVNLDGSVNQVVEIPAGTNSKFEVSEDDGVMAWELKNGKPRVIDYLGYPGNYGMIPRTMGGDGDSLDGLTLGKMQLRGSVVAAKVIGVFHLIDGGDVDDKLIMVLPGTKLYAVDSIAELDEKFPGITTIIETWLTNYKGPDGGLVSGGFGGPDDAWQVLQNGFAAYAQ